MIYLSGGCSFHRTMLRTQDMLKALPKVAGVTLAALAAQTFYTVQRDLPSYEGLDASGIIGSPDLPSLRITALGDSTLTGPGLDRPEQIWIRRAADRLANRYSITITSLAEGGSRTQDVLDRQLPLVAEPDVAVLVVGSNDALHGVPTSVVRSNLVAIVEELLAQSKALIIAGVGDLGSIPRMPSPLSSVARLRGHQIDAVISQVAAVSDRIEKVAMWEMTASRFQRERSHIFAGDLFHPNEHGHQIWADAFYPSLIRAIAIAGVGTKPATTSRTNPES